MKKNIIPIEGDNPYQPDHIDVSIYEGIAAPQAQIGVHTPRSYCYVFIKNPKKVREIAAALIEVAEQMEVINNERAIEK